jgi:hypothetical protein
MMCCPTGRLWLFLGLLRTLSFSELELRVNRRKPFSINSRKQPALLTSFDPDATDASMMAAMSVEVVGAVASSRLYHALGSLLVSGQSIGGHSVALRSSFPFPCTPEFRLHAKAVKVWLMSTV